MEALMAEPWYWILGSLLFVFVILPVTIGYFFIKFITFVRDWWNSSPGSKNI